MNGSDAVRPPAVQLDEAGRLKADIERTRSRLAETAEQLAAMTGARNPATRQQVTHARHAAPRRPPGLAAVVATMATAAAAALVAVRRWGKR